MLVSMCMPLFTAYCSLGWMLGGFSMWGNDFNPSEMFKSCDWTLDGRYVCECKSDNEDCESRSNELRQQFENDVAKWPV